VTGDLRMRIARALAHHQQADLALDAHRYGPEKWLCCATAVLAALDETDPEPTPEPSATNTKES
jgi:hypothetical protein